MITTITERQRQASSLSSVNCYADRAGTLVNNAPNRKAYSWPVHKIFPIVVKFGHLRTATDKNLNATGQLKIIKGKVTEVFNLARSHNVPNKVVVNFFGKVTLAIH